MRRFVSVASAIAALLFAAAASAQTADVVVGVPIRDGKAGTPRPGVIVDLEGKERREPLPEPIVLQELGREAGTTTIRPSFGGGYTVETPGKPTTAVRPRFGGGYTIDRPDGGTTEVVPQFGGGYKVERRAPGETGR